METVSIQRGNILDWGEVKEACHISGAITPSSQKVPTAISKRI